MYKTYIMSPDEERKKNFWMITKFKQSFEIKKQQNVDNDYRKGNCEQKFRKRSWAIILKFESHYIEVCNHCL